MDWSTPRPSRRSARDDDTLAGRLGCPGAGASLPDPEAKDWAWHELTTNRERSNYELNALASGFWSEDDLDLLRALRAALLRRGAAAVGVGRAPTRSGASSPSRSPRGSSRTSHGGRQRGGPRGRRGLTPAVRRSIVDADSELREALRSRQRFDEAAA